MQIDLTATLTIIIGLLTIIGSIYRLAQMEANINAKMSLMEYSLNTKISIVEAKIVGHLIQYDNDKEYIYMYRLNDNEKTIEHKFNRLANWINQISGYLNKQNKENGFQIRDDKF